MNTKAVANALNKISEGFAEWALAIEQPGAGASVPPRSAPAPVDDLPPLSDDDYPDAPVAKPKAVANQADAALGKCPIHGVAWTIKAAGVGANGPYDAFYKCSEKDPNQPKGYCTQKPQKIWRDTHPIPVAA